MRKLNAPGDSVQDVFSTCIESYRDAALKNRLRSIVPVLSDEASRFEDCVLTSKTHTIPTADNVGGGVSKAEMLDIYESKFVKGTGRPYYDKYMSLPTNGKCPWHIVKSSATLSGNGLQRVSASPGIYGDEDSEHLQKAVFAHRRGRQCQNLWG